MNDNAEHGPLHFSREVPHKAKVMCHDAVKEAVRDGQLVPEPCCVCGATLNVVAHHDDYARPLDVLWLCQTHHSARHGSLGHESTRSGRPPSVGGPGRNVTVRLPAPVEAELTAALRPGESLAALLRDGGLRLARERAGR